MFLRFNLFTIVWALVILALILLPGQQMPKVEANYFLSIDKLAHAFVFLVLTLFMIVGFAKQHSFVYLKNNPVKYALLISGIYSIVLEGMQYTSSERMVELYDGVANLSGCALGYLVFLLIYRA